MGLKALLQERCGESCRTPCSRVVALQVRLLPDARRCLVRVFAMTTASKPRRPVFPPVLSPLLSLRGRTRWRQLELRRRWKSETTWLACHTFGIDGLVLSGTRLRGSGLSGSGGTTTGADTIVPGRGRCFLPPSSSVLNDDMVDEGWVGRRRREGRRRA